MIYSRNTNLDYYIDEQEYTNCGSYALRLNEWYDPEDYFERRIGNICDWIGDQTDAGYSDEEISNIYGEILFEGISEEFANEIELWNGMPPAPGTELIAFNTFCRWDDDWGADWDFHFKVLRDGKWMEKCGPLPVEECDEYDWGRYIGTPIYFCHRIEGA